MNQEELKSKLSPEQFEVTQHWATERPFTGEYNDHFEKGIYVDVVDVPRSLYREINSNRAVAGLLFQNRSIKTL